MLFLSDLKPSPLKGIRFKPKNAVNKLGWCGWVFGTIYRKWNPNGKHWNLKWNGNMKSVIETKWMRNQEWLTYVLLMEKNPADHVRYIKSDCNNGRFFIFLRRDFFRQFGLKSATKINKKWVPKPPHRGLKSKWKITIYIIYILFVT